MHSAAQADRGDRRSVPLARLNVHVGLEAQLPSVAVVIPTYNRASWLPATLESVLRQTRPADEILVIDDGSKDDTAEVCEGFAPRVRYIGKENAGVAEARNFGVRQATSDWVAFLDSDDLWEPEKLEIQMAAHEAVPEAGWSFSDCILVDGNDRPLGGRQGLGAAVPMFKALGMSPADFFAGTLARVEYTAAGRSCLAYTGDLFGPMFYGNAVVPSSAMVRRDLFLRTGGFDPGFRLAEETEYFHRLASLSPVVVAAAPLLRWRMGHEERLTATANTRVLVRNALESLSRAASLRQLAPAEAAAFAAGREYLLLHLAYVHLSLVERPEARQALHEAWQSGARRTVGARAVYAATLLPAPVLHGLYRLKRLIHA